MPIPVVCPSCGNNIQAPDRLAGRTLRCHKCLNPFTVPNIAPAPMVSFAPPPAAAGPAPFELTEEMPWNQPPAAVAPAAAPAGEVGWNDVPDMGSPAAPLGEMPSTQDELPVPGGADEEVVGGLELAEDAPAEEAAEEPAGPRKSRMIAALLGIVVPFGIHRFYLGYTGIGVLQLILSCAGIGSLWAFLEGVLLLIGAGIKKDAKGVPLR